MSSCTLKIIVVVLDYSISTIEEKTGEKDVLTRYACEWRTHYHWVDFWKTASSDSGGDEGDSYARNRSYGNGIRASNGV